VLENKEKSFAAKLFSDVDAADMAKGPSHERGLSAGATNLRLWDKSGRMAAGLSWSSYVTDQWDDAEGAEKLTLVFAQRYVLLWGHHLLTLVRQIDEGRLKSITEVDGLHVQELVAENASIRDVSRKIPIVTRFELGPEINDLVGALKGEEDDETRQPGRAK
jgi:hypothetical protein